MNNYPVYKEIMKQLEKRYQLLHREIEEKLSRQIEPLLIQYDVDIELLEDELSKERTNQLFDICAPFVHEHDEMLKSLNAKFQSAKRMLQERYLEENKLIIEREEDAI